MPPLRSMIEVGELDNMSNKYNLKIKFIVFTITLAISFSVVISISAFKDSPYATLRYAETQSKFLQFKFNLNLTKTAKSENNAISVPVIMYHGIGNENNGDTIKPENFNQQMISLKNNGWETTTLSDLEKFLHGEITLPEKSFLLAFEDGRKDSFYEADPILHALGFKAVMYVIADASLQKRNSFHLDRQELAMLEKSGRWEIESHGELSHSLIQVDEAGDVGDFYANKKWLKDDNRLETDEEFYQRIHSDLYSAKTDLEEALNKEISSLSFPFGGGENNYPESESVVLSIAKSIYPYTLYQYWPKSQDGFTGNYAGDENQMINRINIDNTWSEAYLMDLVSASAGQTLPYSDTFGKNQLRWIPLIGDIAYSSNTLEMIPEESNLSMYLDGSKAWENYSFRVNLETGFTNNTLSLLAHYLDAKNYLSCEFRPDTITIKNVVAGESFVLKSIKVGSGYQKFKENELAIDISSTTVKCILNGEQLLVAANSKNSTSGGVALKSWNTFNNFDSLVFNDISVVASDDFLAYYSTSNAGKEIIYKYLDEGKLEIANQMRRNVYEIDRYAPVTLDSITWKENPYNEQYWRFMFYSLQPTKNLLAIWDKTGNYTYLNKLKEILNSYLDKGQDGPFAWDLHGTAFRTMVLTNTYKKLEKQGYLDESLREKLKASLIRHGDFLYKDYNYEGSYNHGIDQSLALYVLAVNFPELDKDSLWLNKATSRIISGLNTTVDQDGILVENSPYYHFYALDKYWQFSTYLKKNNLSLGSANDAQLQSKLKKMIGYGTYIIQPDSSIPLLGASLDGKVTKNGTYAEMGAFDQQFLYAITQGQEGQRPAYNSIYYPTAGQTIIRSGWGPDYYKYQSQLIFDVGAYRTNHSDLDALSFSLYGNGIALLPDSGLYTYEAGAYRDYFHGTRGHNTVVVDGQSQMTGEKPIGLDDKPYKVIANKLVNGSGYSYQSASHTLYPNVTHNRGIVMLEGRTMIIVDKLYSNQVHDYEQMFHIFPDAELEVNGNLAVAKSRGYPVMTIRQLESDNIVLNKSINSKDPVDGACSGEYEVLVPCYSLAYKQKSAEARYLTAVTIGDDKNINYSIEDNYLIVKMGSRTYNIKIDVETEQSRDVKVKKFIDHRIVSKETLVDDFSNIFNWSEEGNYNGAIKYYYASSSEGYLEIALPLSGDLIELKRHLDIDMTKERFILDMNVNNLSEAKQIDVQVSNDNWKNFATYNFKSDIYPYTFDGEWVKASLSAGKDRKNVLGNWYFYRDDIDFDWSQVDGIRLRFKSYGGDPVTVKLKQLKQTSIQEESKLVIIFDDGWSSVLDAADIMRKYGLKGNTGVVANNVGHEQYMTVDDLKKLQDEYGWNVVSHSSLHKAAVPYYYGNNDLAGLEADITDGMYFLEKNGINTAPNWYIYPNGSTNKSVEEIVSKLYVYARSTNDAPEMYPFANPYGVKVFSVYSDRADAQDTINAVRDAIKFNQSLFLMFHKFSETDPDVYTEISLNEFESIIKNIAESGIKVYTLKDYDKSHGVDQSQITISERIPEKLNISVTAK